METPGASVGPPQLDCSWWLSILLSYQPLCLVRSELFVCLVSKFFGEICSQTGSLVLRISPFPAAWGPEIEGWLQSICWVGGSCMASTVCSCTASTVSGHVASTVSDWGLSLWPWHGFLGIWNQVRGDISIASVFWRNWTNFPCPLCATL